MVRPRFVDTADGTLLEFAERLLQVYRVPVAPTRGEVEEMVEVLLATHPDTLLARGLDKLLADRSDFAVAAAQDYPAWRAAIFRASGEMLRQGAPAEVGAYRDAVLARAAVPAGVAAQGLYADLPENERLTRFRDLSPRQLLERYNVGLVQASCCGLRRWTSWWRHRTRPGCVACSSTCVSPAPGPSLAGALWQGGDAAALRLHIDGPASLFAEAKRYGLQLPASSRPSAGWTPGAWMPSSSGRAIRAHCA